MPGSRSSVKPERVTRAPVNKRGRVRNLLTIEQYLIALRDQVVAINRPALSPAQILKCRCLSQVACKYIFTDPPQVEPRCWRRIKGKRSVFARIEDGGSPGRP